VDSCKGKPTNLKKDCDPMFLHAKKYRTEVEIISQRNKFLFREIDLLAWANKYDPTDEMFATKQADEFRLLAEEESAN